MEDLKVYIEGVKERLEKEADGDLFLLGYIEGLKMVLERIENESK